MSQQLFNEIIMSYCIFWKRRYSLYIFITKTKVVMSNAYTSRSERYFGRNALDFEPSRWSKKKQDKCPIHPFSTLPFGFGKRNCIGKRLAEQEIYLTIIKVIKEIR